MVQTRSKVKKLDDCDQVTKVATQLNDSGEPKNWDLAEHQQYKKAARMSKIGQVVINVGSSKLPPYGSSYSYGGQNQWKSRTQVRDEAYGFDPAAPDKGRRKHETRVFVTINPNRGGLQRNPRNKKAARQVYDDTNIHRAMEHVVTELSTDSGLKSVLVFGPVDNSYDSDTYDSHVESVTVSACVEKGDKYFRSHGHLYITFVHYSQVQISKRLLMFKAKQWYNSFLDSVSASESDKLSGGKKMYVHVKLMPQSDWADVIKMYLEKQLHA